MICRLYLLQLLYITARLEKNMNSSENYKIVKSALLRRRSIKAMYHGKERLLSPHVIGHTDGHEQALFYQFGGESNSRPIIPGSTQNWRCLRLSEITILEIIDDWKTADNHSSAQHCVHDVDKEVEY